MGTAVFRRGDGILKAWSRWDDLAHDDLTEVKLRLDTPPDRLTQRWDGANGVRLATREEADALNAADAAEEATSGTSDLVIASLIEVLSEQIPLPSLMADVRARVVAKRTGA